MLQEGNVAEWLRRQAAILMGSPAAVRIRSLSILFFLIFDVTSSETKSYSFPIKYLYFCLFWVKTLYDFLFEQLIENLHILEIDCTNKFVDFIRDALVDMILSNSIIKFLFVIHDQFIIGSPYNH